jgi:putative ABC transport system permease protein
MRPDDRELDEELRGHVALSIQERVERGDDPDTARRAAYLELGYLPAIRDSVHRIWYSRWLDAAGALGDDLRVALRSLGRAKGLAATVIVTLALGIGANAAIFSVVRGVLLQPLVNRGEDRLVYLRQSAPGIGVVNTTFSVPEIGDLKARARSIESFGDFSTINFTLIGLGDPRLVHAGVVSGSYFEVMGLRPILGRLLNTGDDGPKAAPVLVLTHRFWTTGLGADRSLVGRTIRLGGQDAMIVGVLEPSVPYPADTEIIANVVASAHHLDATMTTQRAHRMTEVVGRLAPGVSIDQARLELQRIHGDVVREHPDVYSPREQVSLSVTTLRDQISAPAKPILLILLAAAAVVFVIACSNVANLILARSVRRQNELEVLAALGASRGALRRSLLGESLLLCGAGAALGVALAGPFVSVVARFVSRFSVRALDVTLDWTVLWVGAGLALAASVVLAYIPKLPTTRGGGTRVANGAARVTPAANRRLRTFATLQVALSFVLVAGAGALFVSVMALQRAVTSPDLRQVLTLDIPSSSVAIRTADETTRHQEMLRRIARLPDVIGVAAGASTPWRDAAIFPRLKVGVGGTATGGRLPTTTTIHARFRVVGSGYFEVLGVRVVAGRDFTSADRDADPVVVVSQSVANLLFPGRDAVGRTLWWIDPVFARQRERQIVGVVADFEDEGVVPGPAFTVYHFADQIGVGGRVMVRASGDPYLLVPSIRQVVREVSVEQPVENPSTLEDARAELLAPDRVKAMVVAGFAGIALLIAVVGVAGVLAFSVNARTREFGLRLAVGSTPRGLLASVLNEGLVIASIGIAAGAVCGYGFVLVAASYVDIRIPGLLPIAGAAALLALAAIAASLLPAARASRVDVMQALRSE